MKRKTITLVVYMLVCLSLVSVGFAAWIITGGEGKEVQGNITANPVVDESISISQDQGEAPQWIGSKSTISFGKPVNADNGTKWLQFDNNVPDENLEVTYQIYISVKSGTIGQAIQRLDKSKVALTFNASSQIQQAVTDKFINFKGISFRLATSGDFTTYTTPGENGDPNNFYTALKGVSESKQVIQVKVEYKWGPKFSATPTGSNDGTNPFTFYNTEYPNPTADVKEEAFDNLNELYTTLGGVTPANFTLKILIGAEPAAQQNQGTN